LAVIEAKMISVFGFKMRVGFHQPNFSFCGGWFGREDESSSTVAKEASADEHAWIII
jgi:hypothetical protein